MNVLKSITSANIPNTNLWYQLLIALVYVLVIFFHLWQLDSIPKGFYTDELASGYNAITIANEGVDEYGYTFPLYFQSFNDYKQPIYIYSTALVFKIFGISEYNLRLVSFLYFMVFIFSLHLLIGKLFPGNKIIILYVLLTAGFLPWYFTISRIAFAAVTQLSIVTLALYFIYKTYHDPKSKLHAFSPILAGSLLGLSIYSYTTSRFLSFLLLAIILIVYARKPTINRSLIITIFFFVLAIPFIDYNFRYPGQLTSYFWQSTYLRDSTSLVDKLFTFTNYYLSYFSPSYLLRSGDFGNLRHHSGFGGQLFITTFLLALIGIFHLIRKKIPHPRFAFFLLVCLILTPAAAAITIPYFSPHALRSLLMGLFILVLSCFGLHSLISYRKGLKENILTVIIVFAALITQGYLYTHHYFYVYPSQSIKAYESYDFKSDIARALELKPQKIILSDIEKDPYIFYTFYEYLVPNKANIPIVIETPLAQPNVCIIYFVHFWPPPQQESLPYIDYSAPGNDTQLRCYQEQ